MKKRGKGIATTFYGTGYGNGFPDISRAKCCLKEDGYIYVYVGATEVGQGAKTILAQIAAEAMELTIDKIKLICEDTSLTPDSGTAAASRQTYNTGNGIKIGCLGLKEKLKLAAKEYFGINTLEGVKIADNKLYVKGLPKSSVELESLYKYIKENNLSSSYDSGFTAHTTAMDTETGQGAPYWPYTYSTHCVEIEVDTETGEVAVLKAVCAQDVGKAINPRLIEGQIEGGFAMGMSWALYEDLGLINGEIRNNNFTNYIIPTALDMPEIKTIIIEEPESTGPYGAKGVGEPVMLAAAPAILNAIYDAVGVRVTELPASPERILELISKREGG